MTPERESTKFVAVVAKVQTLADNGLRVYLDLPEQAIEAVAELMIYKRVGVVLDVTVTPREADEPGTDEQQQNHRKIHI